MAGQIKLEGDVHTSDAIRLADRKTCLAVEIKLQKRSSSLARLCAFCIPTSSFVNTWRSASELHWHLIDM